MFFYTSDYLNIIKSLSAQKLEAFVRDMLMELRNLARDAKVKNTSSRTKRTLAVQNQYDGKDLTLTGIIDNYIVEPWDEFIDKIISDFPSDDLYNIFVSHDYIDTTGLYDLLYFITLQTDGIPQSNSFLKLPKESLSQLFSYVKTVYKEFPDILERANAIGSELGKDIREYLLKSMPFLKRIF